MVSTGSCTWSIVLINAEPASVKTCADVPHSAAAPSVLPTSCGGNACKTCGGTDDVTCGPDEYAVEIHCDHTLVLKCANCRQMAADEI